MISYNYTYSENTPEQPYILSFQHKLDDIETTPFVMQLSENDMKNLICSLIDFVEQDDAEF